MLIISAVALKMPPQHFYFCILSGSISHAWWSVAAETQTFKPVVKSGYLIRLSRGCQVGDMSEGQDFFVGMGH